MATAVDGVSLWRVHFVEEGAFISVYVAARNREAAKCEGWRALHRLYGYGYRVPRSIRKLRVSAAQGDR